MKLQADLPEGASRPDRGLGALRRSDRARRLFDAAALAGMLLLVASIPAYAVLETWAGARQERIDWTIHGPPCPVVERPQRIVVGDRKPRVSHYGEARFARYYGHMSCVGFREGPPWRERVRRVCQFNRPGAVAVTAGGRTVTFQTGDTSPATVTVQGDRISCVMGGWFRS